MVCVSVVPLAMLKYQMHQLYVVVQWCDVCVNGMEGRLIIKHSNPA